MNKQLINIAVAKVDGWLEPSHPEVMKHKEGWIMPEVWWMSPNGVLQLGSSVPAYALSYDAILPVIAKLDDEVVEVSPEFFASQRDQYINHLEDSVKDLTYEENILFYSMVQATPLQLCVALLKSLNLWTPEMEKE